MIKNAKQYWRKNWEKQVQIELPVTLFFKNISSVLLE